MTHHEHLKQHKQVHSSNYKIYQSPMNLKHSLVQHVRYNRQVISSNGNAWGGVITFTIPPADIIRNCVLYLKGADLVTNQNLVGGWMFNAFSNCRIRLGASDVLQLPNSQSMALLEYSQCNSQSKRDRILQLAGGAPKASGTVEGYMVLKLPFSSCQQITGLPAKFLGAPITIELQLNVPQDNFILGTAKNSYSNIIQSAKLFCETIVPFGNQEEDLHLPPDSSAFVDYFYKRGVVPASVSLAVTSGVSNEITLTNFQNARLAGLLITFLAKTDRDSGDWQKYLRARNLVLKLNGQNLFDFGEYSFEMNDICNGDSKGALIPCYTVAGGSTIQDAYKYFFKLEGHAIDANKNYDEISSGYSISNNQMSLTFTLDVTDTVYVNIIQVYQNCIRIRGDRTVELLNVV